MERVSKPDGPWGGKEDLVLVASCASNPHRTSSLSHPNLYLLKIDSERCEETASGLGRRLARALGVQLQPMPVHPIRESPDPGTWLAGGGSWELCSNGLKSQKPPACERSSQQAGNRTWGLGRSPCPLSKEVKLSVRKNNDQREELPVRGCGLLFGVLSAETISLPSALSRLSY